MQKETKNGYNKTKEMSRYLFQLDRSNIPKSLGKKARNNLIEIHCKNWVLAKKFVYMNCGRLHLYIDAFIAHQ